MNISRQDAAAALEWVDSADRRMDTLRRYRDAAPYLQLWGAVWFIANLMTDLWPGRGATVWLVAVCAGMALTAILVVRQSRRRIRLGTHSREERRRLGQGFALLFITIVAYFISMSMVLGHLDERQSNAFISLFWAFTYMAAGAWLGMRLFLTGAFAVVGIVTGFVFIHQHFDLWMAVFGGGSLMLAGFWLRRP